ncbi:protease complex subunit PrcB family protein [Petrocella sp. FN5]|uniref:protease complex subunit PrcB family protein n=1 Tax=Petrocella sp. FN5 TaxID=3032002 RepID=UPI0023DCB364|nr:protease complex subunit PrcB family protein [Petrocella sp. FN5]MDF1617387.1 protease complex subunit PrcB family protein [Petrocella sp. FN5]
MKKFILIISLLGMALFLYGCNTSNDSDDNADPTSVDENENDSTPVAEEPSEENYDIIGVITSLEASSDQVNILVEGDITPDTSYDKASVRLDGKTKVYADQEAADIEDLIVGMTVKVNFEGPVAESYPVQAYANRVTMVPSPGKATTEGEPIEYEVVVEEEPSIEFIKSLRGFGLIREDDDYYYVYIGSGERNTGGYDIYVSNVAKIDDQVLITVSETLPNKDDMVTQAITYPYQIIRYSKDHGNQIIVQDYDGNFFDDINDETTESE